MNHSLRTSIGIFSLILAASVSVSEVNAQSIYPINSGWQLSHSQPAYSATPQLYRPIATPQFRPTPQSYGPSATTSATPQFSATPQLYRSNATPQSFRPSATPQSYPSAVLAPRTYQSQSHSSYWPQNSSSSPRYTHSNKPSFGLQTQATLPQRPPANLSTFTAPPMLSGCQPGGT